MVHNGLREVTLMKQLFAAMERDPAIRRLVALSTGKPKELLAYGLGGSVKFAAIAASFAAIPRTMVILVHGREILADWRESLLSLLPNIDILVLPEMDALHIEADAKSMERMATRMNILSRMRAGDPIVVLTDAAAAVQKDFSREYFERASLSFHTGDTLFMEGFLNRLVKLGYVHSDEVEFVGNFSTRGGIIDVFPVNATMPVRIEFFGDAIDSMRRFDIDTKRSQENIECVSILPLSCGNVQDAASDVFLTYLSDVSAKSETNEEKFHAPMVVFDEPMRFRETLRRMIQETPEIKDTIVTWGELVSAARGKTVLYSALMLQKIAEASPAETISLQGMPMTPFQRQMDLLESELSRWLSQKQSIIVFMPSKEKANAMRELLVKRKIPAVLGGEDEALSERAVNIRMGNLVAGLEIAAAHLVVITERDIFGRSKRHMRTKSSAVPSERIMHFRDIKPGEYVVHEAHGIGKYLGVETLEVGGVHRDYLHIKYGGDDKLFVPTDQVGLLQKYIGSEGDTPRLHRMGGTEWVKAKARVRKSVEDIAKKLIAIYAKRKNARGYAFSPDDSSQHDFEEAFPYQETDDQLRAIAEIKADMEREKPMERLLCGDVGFGKTEVAIRAAYKAALDGKQVAVLVPTTVLAQQHYQTFSARFQDFEPTVDVICRFRTAKQQKATLEKLALGQVDILIGTHAILNQKKVIWKDLGLLIVDEEQRFGVKQKEKIKSLAEGIDVLTLSATPIPRTLHMSLVGARDMSVIETPPAERFPVQTYVVENSDAIIASAIKREIRRGGQIYFIYNRVDTIEHMCRRLKSLVPEARITVAHGQMPEKQLEHVMMDFYEGTYDILLATSIIENGLDVANANTILIYNADHFGLSQLYQMRGRVGRAHHMAFAYFIYQGDKILTEMAEKRLQTMKDFAELGAGFKIAMRDLEIRGAGNLLGAQQHGHIASVGFEMYVKLLEEAVDHLQSGRQEIELPPEPVIDIETDAYIDGSYIDDAMHKIEIYQHIAAIRKNEEIPAFIDELIDRFGEPTKPVMRLLAIARIKNYARMLHMRMVKETPLAIEFYMLPEKKLPAKGLLCLNRFFKQRLKMLPERKGFYILLTETWKKDILNVVTRILLLASGENMAMETQDAEKSTAGKIR